MTNDFSVSSPVNVLESDSLERVAISMAGIGRHETGTEDNLVSAPIHEDGTYG